jgi:hypothetical protein
MGTLQQNGHLNLSTYTQAEINIPADIQNRQSLKEALYSTCVDSNYTNKDQPETQAQKISPLK